MSLAAQVGSYCPLCGDALFNKKRSGVFKNYELAHVYPLNPSNKEKGELNGVPRLATDVNDPANIIALCPSCHGKFDKPRTREEYLELYELKKKLLDRDGQRALFSEYPLEQELRRVIGTLNTVTFENQPDTELVLEAKSVEAKFDDTLPGPTRRKIRNAVVDYYQHIRGEFRRLELDSPMASEVIYGQVKSFYKKQKSLGLDQPQIFSNVVGWIHLHAAPKIDEAAEILAAYFVQNCEVFE